MAHLVGEYVVLDLRLIALIDGVNLPVEEGAEPGQEILIFVRDGEIHRVTVAG
jgi:hypothetical protein